MVTHSGHAVAWWLRGAPSLPLTFNSVGTSAAISGFLITEPTEASAALAPSFTFGCECVSTSVSAGTTCGSAFESGLVSSVC